MAKVKKTLALEIISFKHPQTNETALVRRKPAQCFKFECNIEVKSLRNSTPLKVVKFFQTNALIEVFEGHWPHCCVVLLRTNLSC